MADINLTHEADKLMAMEKRAVDEKELLFPPSGERLAVELISLDKREKFMLDVTRAEIKLTKATYQNRARAAIILIRLDLDGPPHRNPDGAEVPCPHLHMYREGYGDKWAVPAPLATYTNTLDLFATFEAFMEQCNVTDPPRIRKGLFS
jgi:MoaA/NifB/PqqE/SkfB family radical SAM enzyme